MPGSCFHYVSVLEMFNVRAGSGWFQACQGWSCCNDASYALPSLDDERGPCYHLWLTAVQSPPKGWEVTNRTWSCGCLSSQKVVSGIFPLCIEVAFSRGFCFLPISAEVTYPMLCFPCGAEYCSVKLVLPAFPHPCALSSQQKVGLSIWPFHSLL